MDCSPRQVTPLYSTALDTLKSFNMCRQGDRVAIGVSGGADSVALLAFLCSVGEELSLELVVCHLNHCLRGQESDGDAEFVRRLAEERGLEFCLCTFDAAGEAQKAGVGVEEYARNRRYAFLQQCAGSSGKVATAHTLSDAMETMLFNLIRGTGVRGLRGIPRQRDNIIRPLRDCTRQQVEAYLAELGQPYRTDSTNSSDLYSRNYIRHQIIPAMQRLNPSLPATMGRTMEQMDRQWQMTRQLGEQARVSISRGEYTYDRELFLALPEPVSTLLLQQWLEEAGAEQSAGQLERMQHYARAGSGGVEVTGGVRFVVKKESLSLLRERAPSPPFQTTLQLPPPGESADFPANGTNVLRITCISMKNNNLPEKFNNLDFKNLVDCAKIKEHVFATEPRAEDAIYLQGRQHRLFTRYRVGSRGLDTGTISGLTVVRDASGILWAERLGCDQCHGVDPATACAYIFEVLEETKQ